MSMNAPIACTLGEGDLEQRLASIAEIGRDSLISRKVDGGRHLLRFHPDDNVRRRLEEIVAAEVVCCSFLDLSLSEHDDELILAIAAPKDAQAVADGLAVAFGAVA